MAKPSKEAEIAGKEIQKLQRNLGVACTEIESKEERNKESMEVRDIIQKDMENLLNENLWLTGHNDELEQKNTALKSDVLAKTSPQLDDIRRQLPQSQKAIETKSGYIQRLDNARNLLAEDVEKFTTALEKSEATLRGYRV